MKNLIYVAVLLLIVSSLSFGQSATVTATATVYTALSISPTTATLAIGNVIKGTTKTILSNAAGAVAFTITGEPNTSTVLTVGFPLNLSDGTNDLPFTGEIPLHHTTNVQASASPYSALTGGNATTNVAGNLYIWIGGGVTADAAQISGNYTGTINVAVVYP
jgi:hypothetical protein